MSMKEAVTKVFNNYANFKGRARRSEYWYFVLFNMIVSGVLFAIMSACREESFLYRVAYGLDGLYGIAVFVPGLAVAWRRLHDIGKSGGNYFWVLVPLVGPILLLVWLARDGDRGDNAYGSDPKEEYRGTYYQNYE